MRHKIFLILFLLSLYVVYISCTDLLNDSSKEGQWTSSFSLDEARTYFEENAEDLQPLTLSARVKTRNDGASAVELTPNWDCATIEHNSEVTLFLIPLRSISVPLVNATIFKDGKFEYKYHPESERRLLIAKRSNGDMEMFVTTRIPEIENTDNDAKEIHENIDRKTTLNLTEESLKSRYIIADCCHPIPGDDVLGYYDENKHITIHKRNCSVANTLKSSHGDRILAAKWETHKQLYFVVPIQITGIDDMGVLHEITTIISQQLNANIQKMHIESNNGIFEGTFWINVHDVQDVKNICENLKKINNIKTIARIG